MLEAVNISNKIIASISGGMGAWFIAEFSPAFSLLGVATAFILWDVVSAFRLGRRVARKYPNDVEPESHKFASSKFGKVVDTIIQSYAAIMLCYAAEHWVTEGMIDLPLAKIAAGVVIGWQGWSVLENEMSCREPGESRLLNILHRILIDKTERHLNISLEDLKNDGSK